MLDLLHLLQDHLIQYQHFHRSRNRAANHVRCPVYRNSPWL